MATLKEIRYEHLVADGFVPFEAKALSRNRITSPSMMTYRKERRRIYSNFVQECKAHKVRVSKGRYLEAVKGVYDDMEWYDSSGKYNPFARLKELANILHATDEQEHKERYKKKKPKKIIKSANKIDLLVIILPSILSGLNVTWWIRFSILAKVKTRRFLDLTNACYPLSFIIPFYRRSYLIPPNSYS